ncbi:MAG: hypothetical protein K1W24_07575 [Lachnospiraceae bacterium]
MNTKTMEGLIGARTNINIANVPMKVYKDAERRGDTATMERAIGYVSEFEVKADNYKTKAYDGMKEDAKEARERKKAEQEKAAIKRREEEEVKEEANNSLKENIYKNGNVVTDTVEISAEGKAMLEASKTANYTETADSPANTQNTDTILHNYLKDYK